METDIVLLLRVRFQIPKGEFRSFRTKQSWFCKSSTVSGIPFLSRYFGDAQRIR